MMWIGTRSWMAGWSDLGIRGTHTPIRNNRGSAHLAFQSRINQASGIIQATRPNCIQGECTFTEASGLSVLGVQQSA